MINLMIAEQKRGSIPDAELSWLEARQKVLTGSDAAVIMGDSPYMNTIDLWEIKTGKMPARNIENEFTTYGRAAEHHLIELFKLDFPHYEVTHKNFDLRYHPEHKWLAGSIDAEIVDRESGKRGILEVKTANIKTVLQNNQWRDGVPQHYFWQALHYLLVTRFDFAVIKAQLKYEFDEQVRLETRHYKFERAEVRMLLDKLLKEEMYFWVHVENDIVPPQKLPRI